LVRKRKGGDQLLEETPPARKQRGEVFSEEQLFQPDRPWYVVHTYSGYEDKVRPNLDQRFKSMDAGDLVFRVVVPSVEEIEIKDGQRRTVPRKIFPGYVLVQMRTLQQEDPAASEQDKALSSKAWTVVRNAPGVTGFVGSGSAGVSLEDGSLGLVLARNAAGETSYALIASGSAAMQGFGGGVGLHRTCRHARRLASRTGRRLHRVLHRLARAQSVREW